jgi:hypothetical protein
MSSLLACLGCFMEGRTGAISRTMTGLFRETQTASVVHTKVHEIPVVPLTPPCSLSVTSPNDGFDSGEFFPLPFPLFHRLLLFYW